MIQTKIEVGTEVLYKKYRYTIRKILSSSKVAIENAHFGIIECLISELDQPDESEQKINFVSPEESVEQAKSAQAKFEAIEPFLYGRPSREKRLEIAKQAGVNVATLYRWLNKYLQGGTLSSLVSKPKDGGKGKSRIDENIEEIIQDELDEFLTSKKLKASVIIKNIKRRCHNLNIDSPSESTIRRRIDQINRYKKRSARFGKEAADQDMEARPGSFSEVKAPLDVVEIDHTQLDVFLVDEVNREPIGKPWITAGIDVYSRMITGLYVSFEAPGSVGTGMCIASSILDKADLLRDHDIEGHWPLWGIMKNVHLDNAKEFRGELIERACKEYNISVMWRALGKTHWGGHIERFFRTNNEEIHSLPGTTFGDIKKRKNYNSEKNAALTLKEFEKLLISFIVNIYHKRLHSGIGMSPEQKWEEGIMGTNDQLGTGPMPIISNKEKVKIDFLPSFTASIQSYGIQKDHIRYYSEILHYYRGRDKKGTKYSLKRDPRDISRIFFWDKEAEKYLAINYRNLTYPPISLWEYRKAKKKTEEQYSSNIDSDLIFKTYSEQVKIVNSAIRKTMIKRKEKKKSNTTYTVHKDQPKYVDESINLDNIKPFEIDE